MKALDLLAAVTSVLFGAFLLSIPCGFCCTGLFLALLASLIVLVATQDYHHYRHWEVVHRKFTGKH